MLFCAGLLTVALTVALVDHPLAYALRVKVVSLFSGEPGVALDFQREPADRPVLASGTAETPMIVTDPCVVSDAEGHHLFFSSTSLHACSATGTTLGAPTLGVHPHS